VVGTCKAISASVTHTRNTVAVVSSSSSSSAELEADEEPLDPKKRDPIIFRSSLGFGAEPSPKAPSSQCVISSAKNWRPSIVRWRILAWTDGIRQVMVEVLIRLLGLVADRTSMTGSRTDVSVGSGDNGPMTMNAAALLSASQLCLSRCRR